MISHNDCYDKIYSFDNIELAHRKASSCKRYSGEVLQFSYNLEENLIGIHADLQHETYSPGRYYEFHVRDPKPRLIMALPYRDRVVHHAICNIIEPIFDRSLIGDTYACRKGKGALLAVKRIEHWIGSMVNNGERPYALKMDVSKYYASINHEILKRDVRKKISCARTLRLLDQIVDSVGDGIGIPLGNLTSQLFANIYLNSIDRYIKEELKAKYYVRYMDDMLILGSDKKRLGEIKNQVSGRLGEIGLSLNGRTSIAPVDGGIDFLGYRQFVERRILRKRIMKTNYRKFKLFAQRGDREALNRSLPSFVGLCKHCAGTKAIENVNKIIQTNYQRSEAR
jgi:retron-type reverse transcriptase